MKRVVVAVACASLSAGAVARAAGTDPAPQSTAVELTRLIMPEENWNRSTQGLRQQVNQLVEATAGEQGTKAPPDFASDVMKDLVSYKEVIDISAGIYAKHYTDAELRDLLAFYRTPVGQKTIRLMPEILQDVNGRMSAVVQQRMPPLMEKLKARIARYADEQRAQPQGSPEKKPPKK